MPNTSPLQPRRWLVPVAFLCVYFFWGSTFVAIRFAVRSLNPALVSGFRYFIAGLVMLVLFSLRGISVRISRREMLRAAALGAFLLVGNNVLLGWAELYVTAGYAALLTASVPILIALVETALPGGKPLSRIGWMGTSLGIGGIVLLLAPVLRNGLTLHTAQTSESRALTVGTAILIVGITLWIIGMILGGRIPSTIPPLLGAAWQMTISGAANLALGTALGGWRTAHWNPGLLYAMAWLTVCGSIIGFTSYTYLSQNVAIAKVATYAYVNPIVAVLLGALFLGESLHGSQWVAMVIILVAVAIVTAFGSGQAKPKTA